MERTRTCVGVTAGMALLALVTLTFPAQAKIAITNVTELQMIGNDPAYPSDGDYVLANDIDASKTVNWNGGAGFKPIRFTGTFDGQGYKITGLYEKCGPIGLFSESIGGEIKNLGLEDVSLHGGEGGALVDHSYGTIILHCYSTGNLQGEGYVGGLVGYSTDGTITNCYSTAVVEVGLLGGGFAGGGLVGLNAGSTIIQCYATGSVTCGCTACGGGLVGINSYECNWRSSTIMNCYATGNVTIWNSGIEVLGGLVGYNWIWGTITNCYAAGNVSGGATGGLVCFDLGTSTNCYYDTNTTGQSDTGSGEPKTTAEMMQQATFVGWDFVNTWSIQEGTTYPYLRGFSLTGTNVTVEVNNGISLTFQHITSPGYTTSTVLTAPPPLPDSYFALEDAYYDLNTTATFSGKIEVGIPFDLALANPRLLHYENGAWVDVTTSIDWDHHIVYGSVASLSPFAVAEWLLLGLIQDLIAEVRALNSQEGIINSLDAKLEAALNALEDVNAHNDGAAVNSLEAFIQAVEAQAGKKISQADADYLIGRAQAIINLIL